MPTKSLSINELVMLLALDDDQGRVRWMVSPYLDYALAGGMLAELSLRGAIRVTPDGDLELLDDHEIADSKLLDEVHRLFRQSDHPRTVAGWVTAVSAMVDLDQRQMEELVEKGILARKEGHFLFIIPTTRFPALDRTPEKEVVCQIRAALLEGGPVDARLAVLITIAHGAHLLRGPLSDGELDTAEKRLQEITRGDAIGGATCELIHEAERALYVASSIPFMGISRI